MSNLKTPLNYPDCEILDSKWKPNSSLKNEWNNCVTIKNPIYSNPLWKKKKMRVKKNIVDHMCCKEVMQCNNPNKWFKKNLPGYQCPMEKKSKYPHFGNLPQKRLHSSFFGIL